uniref:Uncharacterized protein n=1 Tax=Knipowitschia caucasica TaxID=637954 RepID=A0AAV2LLY2_KNICA
MLLPTISPGAAPLHSHNLSDLLHSFSLSLPSSASLSSFALPSSRPVKSLSLPPPFPHLLLSSLIFPPFSFRSLSLSFSPPSSLS